MSIIKPHLLSMSAYLPPLEGRDAKRYTLLDFNERTVPIGESITSALKTYIDSGCLQQYPSYGDIVQRLAEYAGIPSDQLMITNGSDQGIDLVFRSVATPGAKAIIPGPSFAMYGQCAAVESMVVIEPQYTREQGYPLQAVLRSITDQTAIIVISNPNNPCGTLVDLMVIETIAQAAPHAAILVDECYYEYTQVSAVPRLNRYDNLFISRTFSKTWGIPSLRFGYLIASPSHVSALCNVRGPYDINQLAVVAADAALTHQADTFSYVNEVMQVAKPLLESWLNRQAIPYWPSAANYVWVFPEQPQTLNDYLVAEGFLVRPKAYGEQLGLRVTIGTIEQVQALLQRWQQFLDRT